MYWHSFEDFSIYMTMWGMHKLYLEAHLGICMRTCPHYGQVHEVDGLKSGNEAINNVHSQGRTHHNKSAHVHLFMEAWAYPSLHVSCQHDRYEHTCAPAMMWDRGTHVPLFLHVAIGAHTHPYPYHRGMQVPLFIKIRVVPRGFLIWTACYVVFRWRRAFHLEIWSWRSSCKGSEESGLVFVFFR